MNILLNLYTMMFAAGVCAALAGVAVYEAVFVEKPVLHIRPATAAQCEQQLAALLENPACKGKPGNWMHDFTRRTPVVPHAMPTLSYEDKQQ